jgi:hypothetical protein
MSRPDYHSQNLVALVRSIVRATMHEARASARTSAVLSGVVEDVDTSRNVAYVRLDTQARSGDPFLSDNWGNPGVLPMAATGQVTTGEQVRATFDPQAGASANRIGIATIGRRLDIDSTQGVVRFWADDTLVGYMDASRWIAGIEDGPRVQIDPFGGLRVFNDAGLLVGILDGQGLQIKDPDPTKGIVHANINHFGMVLAADDGKQIHFVPSQDGNVVVPKWAGTAPTIFPGANVATPALVPYTPNDLELRYGVVCSNVSLPSTFTPPSGYTEVFDVSDSTDAMTVAASLARRQPHTVDAVRNFVCSQAGHVFHNGHTVLVRANDTGTPPSVRSHVQQFNSFRTANMSVMMAKPAGVVAGDLLVAFVSVGNKGGFVPTSWSVPEGWLFMGAVFRDIGGTDTLASGVWYKQATAAEPADYTISIQVAGEPSSLKRFHAAVVAVQNPGMLEGGSDIRFEPQSACRVYATVNSDFLGLGGGIVVDFNQISYDPGDNFNLTTNRYMVPASGPYKFGFNIYALCGAGEEFRANASRYVGGVFDSSIAGTGRVIAPGAVCNLQAHDVVYLDEGDEVSVDAVQATGTLRGLEGGGSDRSYFYIKRDLST